MRAVFDSIGYSPHEVQRRIHAAKRENRFRLACAGRRTGKSTLGGHELLPYALAARSRPGLSRHERRSEFWVVGPEYSDAEKEFRVIYNDLKKLEVPFDHPGTYNDPIGGNMHISLWDGKFQVHAKSAKYPDSLVGEALEGVIMAEAAKLKPRIWTKFIRPMLADYKGWALFTSTPEGKNWFYDLYLRGLDPNDPGWWSIRMPSWSNDIIFPGGRYDPEIIDMSRDMTEEKFKQEIGAEFTEFVGRVYKRYDEEDHLGNFSYNPRWPLYIATDYGFTNPNVALFIQVDTWDHVTVIGEFYERGLTDREFGQAVLDHPYLGSLVQHATLLYPDPEDPGATATLSNMWKVRAQHNTGGLLNDRINLIRRWLKPHPLELPDGHPDKVPLLRIDRRCKELNREMSEYRYPENKTEATNDREAPLKKDDHAPEALSRFFGGYYGHMKDSSRARQRRAQARR